MYIRAVWFSLILFVMNSDGHWPEAWKPIIQLMAEKSPPLVLSKTAKSLDADLASSSVFQLAMPDSVLNDSQDLTL